MPVDAVRRWAAFMQSAERNGDVHFVRPAGQSLAKAHHAMLELRSGGENSLL